MANFWQNFGKLCLLFAFWEQGKGSFRLKKNPGDVARPEALFKQYSHRSMEQKSQKNFHIFSWEIFVTKQEIILYVQSHSSLITSFLWFRPILTTMSADCISIIWSLMNILTHSDYYIPFAQFNVNGLLLDTSMGLYFYEL